MTVADCVEAVVVARRHRRGDDAHNNPVAAKVSDGAGRVVKKLQRCLEALADANVEGAAEALRDVFEDASESLPASGSQMPSPSADFDAAAASDATAWVVRSGREGLDTVDFNLREGVVTLGWGDWVFD